MACQIGDVNQVSETMPVRRVLPRTDPFGARQAGFTLIELLIVVAIISTIAIFAIPGLLRAHMTANETSAIASLRSTAAAQVAYASGCGAGNYATSFTILGTAPASGGQPFISADLGRSVAPQKSGFNFNLGAGAAGPGAADCQARPTNTGYLATAVPQAFRISGSRAFAVDKGSTIWQNRGSAAPTEPFTASASVSTLR